MSATRTLRHRLGEAQLPGTLCLTTLTVVTVVSLCRIFPDWVYLRPMMAVALGMHLVALVLRVARIPTWGAVPLLLGAGLWLISLTYYRDTLYALVPTGHTMELLRLDMRLVADQFSTAVAPVPSEGSFAIGAAVAIALCVLLADTFAFRAFGRIEAIVPSGVVFVFSAALGTDRSRVVVAALWIGAALLTVAVLRFEQQDDELTWMGSRKVKLGAALPAIVVGVAFSAVVAAAVGPSLPGASDDALIDTRNRRGGVTEVLSPLVDIRAQLVNRGNLELFTVDSSDGAHYWRMVGLHEFDGNAWNPSEEDLDDMGDRSSEVVFPGEQVGQTIVISHLGGHFVPAAYFPVRVAPTEIAWAGESDSLILPGQELQEGDTIRVLSKVVTLTKDTLRAATVSGAPDAYHALPGGTPQEAVDTATFVTSNAATPFDKAIALQDYFQDNFEYDPNVQLSNSNDAMTAFLRDRRGFCQQFAGTFAVMARALGLPARVAVGFTQGDLGADGLFHVYGRHAHAWPEIWFDGFGWVAFEPTPGRGNADTSQYTDVQPDQDNSGGTDDGDPVTDGSTPGGGSGPQTTIIGPEDGRGDFDPTATTTPLIVSPQRNTGAPIGLYVVLALAVVLIAWILAAPRLIARLGRRRANDDTDRVIAAWHRSCNALLLAGAPPIGGETPLEYAVTAERSTGVAHATIGELALRVTRAVYAEWPVTESDARRCERLSDEVAEMARYLLTWQLRLRLAFDPRLMARQFAG